MKRYLFPEGRVLVSGHRGDLTLSEIKSLDATVNANIAIPSESPPTLSELLELAAKNERLLLNIELKDYHEDGSVAEW